MTILRWIIKINPPKFVLYVWNTESSGKTQSIICVVRDVPNAQKRSLPIKKTLTTEEFIKKAKEIHGDKYDYSKVEYTSTNDKVCIICPEHGEFWQRPHNHLKGQGCPKCSGKFKTDTEYFIEKAKKIHGEKHVY